MEILLSARHNSFILAYCMKQTNPNVVYSLSIDARPLLQLVTGKSTPQMQILDLEHSRVNINRCGLTRCVRMIFPGERRQKIPIAILHDDDNRCQRSECVCIAPSQCHFLSDPRLVAFNNVLDPCL